MKRRHVCNAPNNGRQIINGNTQTTSPPDFSRRGEMTQANKDRNLLTLNTRYNMLAITCLRWCRNPLFVVNLLVKFHLTAFSLLHRRSLELSCNLQVKEYLRRRLYYNIRYCKFYLCHCIRISTVFQQESSHFIMVVMSCHMKRSQSMLQGNTL